MARRRAFATASEASQFASREPLLMRDYIQRSLYDPIHGYFSNSESPVLAHGTEIKLRELQSRAAYQGAVAATYASTPHGWMTPVELFSPFFSRAVANRIQGVSKRVQNVNIIEIGGGRGTLASDMLEHWSQHAPDFLENVSYNLLEISPSLAKLQSKVLHKWIGSGRAKVHNADAVSWFHSLPRNGELSNTFLSAPCHIIAMEVLDNLPHDLVRINSDNAIEQAITVHEQSSGPRSCGRGIKWISELDETTNAAMAAFDCLNPNKEMLPSRRHEHRRSSFSLINMARASFEGILSGGRREIWVPTTSFLLMQAIASSLPHAQMTVSDFNSIPGALPGENGPVVQSVERGSAIVYDSVADAPFGRVDIMFPTNFHSLQGCHEQLFDDRYGHRPLYHIMSQQNFFEEYSSHRDIEDCTCLDGYNPVLQDFDNASFFLID